MSALAIFDIKKLREKMQTSVAKKSFNFIICDPLSLFIQNPLFIRLRLLTEYSAFCQNQGMHILRGYSMRNALRVKVKRSKLQIKKNRIIHEVLTEIQLRATRGITE
jgi:hypothetical protein